MTASISHPSSWSKTILGKVLELKYGKALPAKRRDGTDFPVYGSNGVVGMHSEPLVDKEGLIVGRKGSFGEVHMAKTPFSPIDTTYFVDDLFGQPLEYWFYFLRHLPLTELNRSTAIPGLNREDAYELPIVLPGMEEQKQIAAKLDELLAQVDSIKTRLDAIPAVLKRFRQSVLAAAVSGRLTEDWRKANSSVPSGNELKEKMESEHFSWWCDDQLAKHHISGKKPVNENWKKKYKKPEDIDLRMLPEIPKSWGRILAAFVVEPGAEIVYGIVQPGPKLSEGIPYVRGKDIRDGKIAISELLFTSPEIAKKYERASLQGGDILLGIIRATKVAIVPDELLGANITQGTARFRPGSCISTDFLAYYLESPEVQAWLHSNYRGIDMPGLNLKDVRRLPVSLPPKQEQEEVVKRVSVMFSSKK